MHILLLPRSSVICVNLYDNARLSNILSVSGANVALYCANRFHTELLHDEDYQNNLDDAVGHVFFRSFN
jgi:hypothetical protein